MSPIRVFIRPSRGWDEPIPVGLAPDETLGRNHLLPRYRDIVGFCRRNMRFAPQATFGFVGEFAIDRSAKLPAAVDRDQ
jgi:hypothetical protein